MKLESSVITNKGGRDVNEDSCGFILFNEKGFWAVADGLGGHIGGKRASKIAIDTVMREFINSSSNSILSIADFINKAQEVIKKEQLENPKYKEMRTTLVLLLANEEGVRWGHIGDSRLYLFSNRILKYRTKDHSVPQALVNAGEFSEEDIRFHEDRNKLLKVVGMDSETLNPDTLKEPYLLNKGDVFLLCTDGFWEYVTEKQMEKDLIKSVSPMEWLKRMEKRIIRKSTENNDNYTAMAVFVK